MANISRFNPFDDPLDELFSGFFVRPVSSKAPRRDPVPHRRDRERKAYA